MSSVPLSSFKPTALRAAWLTACLSLATLARGQMPNDIPEYTPGQEVTGCIRSWGTPEMGPVMKRWEEAFAKYQPKITFSDNLKGSETAQVPLAFKVADMALMDRDLLFIERYNMFQRRHHWVTLVSVATGSSEAPDKACALAIFVHKDNPIAKLTLKQLDGIFGEARVGAWDDKLVWHAEAARTAAEDIRTWGQLGLTGEWADKPIHPYGFPTLSVGSGAYDPGKAHFFRTKVLSGSDKWNPNLREYVTGEESVEALANDPYGIAYAESGCRTPAVKALAVAASADREFSEPTRETVASRKYPLARPVYITIGRAPGDPVEPRVREFLRYVLSRQGQEEVARDGSYLPLAPALAAHELKKIE